MLLRFNPLYTGHKLTQSQALADAVTSVSIPYTRVTSAELMAEILHLPLFQSPIHGSQALIALGSSSHSSRFQSPIHGSQALGRVDYPL
jgi:hypothetical protein